MLKIQKDYITPKWLKVKEIYKNGTNGSTKYGKNFPLGGELDKLTSDLINELGEITQDQGYNVIIEDVELDLWKERVWNLIENAGLLPEIAWKEEKEKMIEQELFKKDTWYDVEDEFEFEPSDDEIEDININDLF